MEESTVTIRELAEADIDRMVELANNEKISVNLRDQFPHPYTHKDAVEFMKMLKSNDRLIVFAIDYNGSYAGNIGLVLETDVYRKCADIGYFLGEPYWNKGVMTKALNLATSFGFEKLKLVRIHCGVYEYNKASQRVLEKCGYEKEGIFKKAISKKGKIWDEVRFAKINPAFND